MNITQQDIDELSDEINKLREELAEKEAVLRYFQKKLGISARVGIINSVNAAKSAAATASESTQLILSALEQSAGPRPTLKDNIKTAIERLDSREFTVSLIEALLAEDDKAPGGKQPRARIAMILKELEEDGFVHRTYKGKGSEPHRFKQGLDPAVVFGSGR